MEPLKKYLPEELRYHGYDIEQTAPGVSVLDLTGPLPDVLPWEAHTRALVFLGALEWIPKEACFRVLQWASGKGSYLFGTYFADSQRAVQRNNSTKREFLESLRGFGDLRIYRIVGYLESHLMFSVRSARGLL